MLELETASEYGDVMEQALYNTVLAGMALDGKSFFYVNPLEVLPEACHKDERKFHVKPVRQKWFGCACCPPNLARLLSSIPSYAYTEDEESLYMHLYIGGRLTKEIHGKKMRLQIESGFPWSGKVRISFEGEEAFMRLALRIPGWCENWKVNGTEGKRTEVKQGYLYIEGNWKNTDVLELCFPMTPVFLQADERVRENIGKVALKRGPIVYCMEETDNGDCLHLNQVFPEEPVEEGSVQIQGQTFPTLIAKGRKRKREEARELYRAYREAEYEKAELTFIPYYTWANRGENEMSVWIETAK